jgi:hypothetical protein
MTKANQRLTVLIAVACVAGAFGANVFAQSLNRWSSGMARAYVATEIPAIDHPALPPNVEVSETYRPVLESMLRYSPTFRRQCLRIASEPDLRVSVSGYLGPRPAAARAFTRFAREQSGKLSADIHFNAFDDAIELIAHEFEHVIEQVDGVDLPSKAAQADSGVHAIDSGGTIFETRRATKVGLKVAQEVRTAPRRAD